MHVQHAKWWAWRTSNEQVLDNMIMIWGLHGGPNYHATQCKVLNVSNGAANLIMQHAFPTQEPRRAVLKKECVKMIKIR